MKRNIRKMKIEVNKKSERYLATRKILVEPCHTRIPGDHTRIPGDCTRGNLSHTQWHTVRVQCIAVHAVLCVFDVAFFV